MKKQFSISLVVIIIFLLGAFAVYKGTETQILIYTLENHSVTPADNFIFEKDQSSDGLVLCGYIGKEKIVVIPQEVNGKKVVSITNKAFGANSGVKAIKIADSVEGIYEGFRGNKELEYIYFGSGLKIIGEYSFYGCHALKHVELNKGLKRLEFDAFADMDQLTYIYVPDTVTEIVGPAIHIFNKDFVIGGKAGSKAEEYAKLFRYPFEVTE